MFQGATEKIAQTGDHVLGAFGIFQDERGDAVQGVEEEVRVELHLQRLHLGLGELRLELRRPNGFVLIAPVVLERVIERNR